MWNIKIDEKMVYYTLFIFLLGISFNLFISLLSISSSLAIALPDISSGLSYLPFQSCALEDT